MSATPRQPQPHLKASLRVQTCAAVVVAPSLRSRPVAGGSTIADRVRSFVRDEYGRVVGAVAMAVGGRDLAEDAVQDALVKLLRDDHDPDRIGAWVTVVAINEARQVMRRRGAESRAIDRSTPPPPPLDPFHEVEIGGEIREAVATLPERQRDAVLLHYFLDMSVEDTAAALGVGSGTVKTHLHRARNVLAEILGDETS